MQGGARNVAGCGAAVYLYFTRQNHKSHVEEGYQRFQTTVTGMHTSEYDNMSTPFTAIVAVVDSSAMFNMLVIVAVSAAVATRSGNSLKIDRRVVARDVSFYTASIAILVLAFNDGEIRWWEVCPPFIIDAVVSVVLGLASVVYPEI